jgi:predicted RNA-binding Zn-ribbon protein involved in translation (DUF1610 family)
VKPIKRILRTGVRFSCDECGELLIHDKHSAPSKHRCIVCEGPLVLVATSANSMLVGDAVWYRCPGCRQLHMRRRGELVVTEDRTGFREFTYPDS